MRCFKKGMKVKWGLEGSRGECCLPSEGEEGGRSRHKKRSCREEGSRGGEG